MKHILKELGFSEKEADIYLSALRIGSASVSELAKQAKIKRAIAYVVLEKLREKGLVSLSEKRGKQIFIAQDPEKLLQLLALEDDELKESEEKIGKSCQILKR